ncbi:MAG: hypothetical protein EXQ52_04555 [Bryobacterales bacterium]|nr:hypothetical protein [Bryobacterales bacterium]
MTTFVGWTQAREKVESIRRELIQLHKIPERDLVWDFTGMTKEATAGMIAACASRKAQLQYMRQNQTGDGPQSSESPLPVEVNLAGPSDPEY